MKTIQKLIIQYIFVSRNQKWQEIEELFLIRLFWRSNSLLMKCFWKNISLIYKKKAQLNNVVGTNVCCW